MSSTPIFQNPYSSTASQRRAANTFNAKQVGAHQNNVGAPLSLAQLRSHLKKALNGQESGLEAEFKQFLDQGYTYNYLDDKSVRDDLFRLMAKDIKANATSLFNADSSILLEYVEKLGYKDDSLQVQLFKYIEAARTHEGPDPLPLTDDVEGYNQLRELITDPVKGLSLHAANLKELQRSDNAALRFLFTAAVEMGLGNSISKTTKDLKTANPTEHSVRLADNIDNILVKEAKALDEILPSDGSMVYKIANGGRYFIEQPEITPEIERLLKDAPGTKFETGDTFNLGAFFKEAHRLSTQADDYEGKAKLSSHVAQGLGWLSAYYSAANRVARNQDDKDFLNQQFVALSDSIQGKALLPQRISSIIRDSANLSIFSQEFANNFSSSNNVTSSQEALNFFFKNFLDSDYASKPGIAGTLTRSGGIEVPNKDGVMQRHIIKWIDDADIRGDVAASKRLDPGASISLERAVDAYIESVERTSEEVLKVAQNALPNGLGNQSQRAEAQQKIETRIQNIPDIIDLTIAVTQELKDLNKENLINRDFDALKKSLKNFIEKALPREIPRKNLWNNEDGTKTDIQTKLDGLAASLISGNKIDEKTYQFLDVAYTLAGSGNEAYFTDNKGLAKVKDLLTSVLSPEKTSLDFDDILDLNTRSINNLFDSGTSIGRALAKSLESLNTEGLTVEQMFTNPHSEEAGELVNLLGADKDGQIDHGKRISALTYLIAYTKANSSHSQDELLDYISSGLSRNQMGKAYARQALKRTTNAGINLEDNLVIAQRRAVVFDSALKTTQRLAFQRRNQDTLRAIKYFGNKASFDEKVKPSLVNILESIDRVKQMETTHKPVEELRKLLAGDDQALIIINQFCDPELISKPLSVSSGGENPYHSLDRFQTLINDLV